MDLVVEVVQQRDRRARAPRPRRSRARTSAIEASTRERVAQQRLALRVAPSASPRPAHASGSTAERIRTRAVQTARYDRSRSRTRRRVLRDRGRPPPLRPRPRGRATRTRALPILAALPAHRRARRRSTNVPRIRDVETMLALLDHARRRRRLDSAPNEVRVHAASIATNELDEELCEPHPRLVPARRPAARALRPRDVPPPGGDVIGRRRLDTAHPRARRARRDDHDRPALRARRASCAAQRIFLDEASVTGTENAIMAAVARRRRDDDRQRRVRAARAGPLPLPRLARRADRGHRVERAPHRRRRRGSAAASTGSRPSTSRSASFIGLAAVTGGELTIDDAAPEDLVPILPVFARLGVRVEIDGHERARPAGPGARRPGRPRRPDPEDRGRPVAGVPGRPDVDRASSSRRRRRARSSIFEKMFENRLFFVDKLVGMGARIILCDPHRVVVSGPAKLYGAADGEPRHPRRAWRC